MEKSLLIAIALGGLLFIFRELRRSSKLSKLAKENALLRAEKEMGGMLSKRAKEEEELGEATKRRKEFVRRYRDLSDGYDPDSSDM